MHGNLGMVSRNDVVFAIGKSGESEEVLDILPAVRRIGAKVIALTANPNSSLARASTLTLYMPIRREACPLNLAPTTSSDGGSCHRRRHRDRAHETSRFWPRKFRALHHPGGQLGKKLFLKISDVMRSGRRNPVVRINDSMIKLVLEISKKWTGAASVIDRGHRLIGLVTDYDIRRAFAQGHTITSLSIRDIMNPSPTFVYTDEMAVKALEIMESRKNPGSPFFPSWIGSAVRSE